jgi:hypothetical protein
LFLIGLGILVSLTIFCTSVIKVIILSTINWIPTARAGAGLVSKIAPKLSPIKSRFAVGSADAFTAGYTQSELMVANKGFMSEQEKATLHSQFKYLLWVNF